MFRNLATVCLFVTIFVTINAVNGLEKATVPRYLEINGGQFNVPIDHFQPQDNRTATFEFDYDVDYYDVGGPLFFYINEAGDYTTQWITSGLIYDLSRELNGALFTTDLRFFRRNLPTDSATFEELSFLTLEQSLADIVAFIRAARLHIGAVPFSKVYVWGSGLGGTLAVLARQKFPFLITAAWSTGGIFEPTVFTTENYDILSSNLYEYGGDACGFRTAAAFAEIERLLQDLDADRLIEEFSICRPWDINEHMDVGLFSEGLLNQIMQFTDRTHAFGVQSFCSAMNAIPNDPFRSLARWVRFQYNADIGRCFNYNWQGLRSLLSDPLWHNPGTSSGLRQFNFLQCTQIGQLKISRQGSIFGNHITERYRHQMCVEALGPDYDFERLHLAVNDLRYLYGGRNPGVTRVIFTNGLIDTWFSHGITYYYQDDSHVINIPGHGRRSDLGSLSSQDSIVLYNAKLSIQQAFRDWESAFN